MPLLSFGGGGVFGEALGFLVGRVDGSCGDGLVETFFFDEVAYQEVGEFCQGDGGGAIDLGVEPVRKVEERNKTGIGLSKSAGRRF